MEILYKSLQGFLNVTKLRPTTLANILITITGLLGIWSWAPVVVFNWTQGMWLYAILPVVCVVLYCYLLWSVRHMAAEILFCLGMLAVFALILTFTGSFVDRISAQEALLLRVAAFDCLVFLVVMMLEACDDPSAIKK